MDINAIHNDFSNLEYLRHVLGNNTVQRAPTPIGHFDMLVHSFMMVEIDASNVPYFHS